MTLSHTTVKPTIDPTASLEFVRGALTTTYSQINNVFLRVNASLKVIGQIDLADAYQQPRLIIDQPNAMNEYTLGLLYQRGQAIDLKARSGLRSFMFGRKIIGTQVGGFCRVSRKLCSMYSNFQDA